MDSLFPELDRRPPVDPYAAEERAAIQAYEREQEAAALADPRMADPVRRRSAIAEERGR